MSVRTVGFKEYQQKLKNAPQKLFDRIGIEVEDAARDWAGRAVNSAPSDEGFLRNGIDAMRENHLQWEVISREAHSAYMEWGTGTLVNIPAEYSGYAQQFRGKTGGSFEELLKRITAWVRRKGIGDRSNDSNIAFAIALKIVRVGVKPHPFFFIHKAAIEQKLMAGLKNILK